jgi:hypothetical protein
MSDQREEDLKVWPAADEAMRKLVELFSDPSLASKTHFCCCIDGPTEFEIMIESIFDDEDSEYKRWVRRLYDLGLIPRIPREWEALEELEGKSTA